MKSKRLNIGIYSPSYIKGIKMYDNLVNQRGVDTMKFQKIDEYSACAGFENGDIILLLVRGKECGHESYPVFVRFHKIYVDKNISKEIVESNIETKILYHEDINNDEMYTYF